SSAALYDPPTGTWAPTSSPADSRSGHTATRLASGKVLVAGGETECNFVDSSFPQLNTSEEYDPVNGTWDSRGAMGTGRYNHSATLLNDGQVLVAGGIDTLSIIPDSSGCFSP